MARQTPHLGSRKILDADALGDHGVPCATLLEKRGKVVSITVREMATPPRDRLPDDAFLQLAATISSTESRS